MMIGDKDISEEMSKVTLTQAAAMAGGLSKQAIRKAIAGGKLTAEKDEHGRVLVQAGDVERVWPRRPVADAISAAPDPARAEIKMLQERILELVEDRNRWRSHAESLALSLPKNRQPFRWWRTGVQDGEGKW